MTLNGGHPTNESGHQSWHRSILTGLLWNYLWCNLWCRTSHPWHVCAYSPICFVWRYDIKSQYSFFYCQARYDPVQIMTIEVRMRRKYLLLIWWWKHEFSVSSRIQPDPWSRIHARSPLPRSDNCLPRSGTSLVKSGTSFVRSGTPIFRSGTAITNEIYFLT